MPLSPDLGFPLLHIYASRCLYGAWNNFYLALGGAGRTIPREGIAEAVVTPLATAGVKQEEVKKAHTSWDAEKVGYTKEERNRMEAWEMWEEQVGEQAQKVKAKVNQEKAKELKVSGVEGKR
jgi:hypothetical protein